VEELDDEGTLERIRDDVQDDFESAVQLAIDAPFPDPSAVDEHVYA
jgi:TPP-dependent pyruvate/acetoin dehydrogenase alpha subunit